MEHKVLGINSKKKLEIVDMFGFADEQAKKNGGVYGIDYKKKTEIVDMFIFDEV